MAQNQKIKVKSIEVSSRSWFGRPSEMDKAIEQWVNKGWTLQQTEPIRKDRHLLTFVYQMSEEEIAEEKRRRRNAGIGCVVFLAIAYVIASITTPKMTESEVATQTHAAVIAGARTSLAGPISMQQPTESAATPTLRIPTDTPKPSDIPTNTHIPTDTLTPSHTPEPTATVVTAIVNQGQNVNVRRSPSTEAEVVTALIPGTHVVVIGENDDGSWINIQTEDGSTGWTAAFLLDLQDGTAENAPVAFSNTPRPTQRVQPTAAPQARTCETDLERLAGFVLDRSYTSSDYTTYYYYYQGRDDQEVDLDYSEDGYFLPLDGLGLVETGSMTVRGVTVRYGFDSYGDFAFNFQLGGVYYSGSIATYETGFVARGFRSAVVETLTFLVQAITEECG